MTGLPVGDRSISRPGSGWWHALSTVLRLEWISAELHTRQRWVAIAVLPAAYLGLLGVGLSSVLGGESYLAWVLPGVVVMQALSGMSRIMARTVTERRWGLAAFKLQAGISASAYVIGMLTPGIAAFVGQAVIILVLGARLGVWFGVMTSVLVVTGGCVAAVFWECLGYCVAAAIRSYQTRDFLLTVIVMPLTFSAPVFYSLDSVPTFLRLIARVNPLTYQVELVRGFSQSGTGVLPTVISIVELLIALAASVWTTSRMRELSFEG